MTRFALMMLAVVVFSAAASAAEPATQPETVVLGLEQGSFVAFARWKTPSIVGKDGNISALPEPARKELKDEDRQPWPVVAAEPPAKNWATVDFDDSGWPRARGPLAVPQGAWGYGLSGTAGVSIYMPGNQVEWGLMCLRGKFRVDDPSRLKYLKLSLQYLGGVVVFVNGRELCRGHMSEGQVDFDTLATRYSEEAYLRPDGRPYAKGDEKEFAERMKCRVRKLSSSSAADGVAIPAELFRKGINAIAIEGHAAPLAPAMLAHAAVSELTPWPHVGVIEARLTVAGDSTGLTPNVGPADAIELWTSLPMDTVETWDYAHPGDRVRPIRLVGARNGAFSAKVVLSSKHTIRNIGATVSDLTSGASGRIPASAIELRLAEPATPNVSWCNANYRANRFDRLTAKLPAEVAPWRTSLGYGVKFRPPDAAVAPIWVTVRVPADAAPGEYGGTLTLQAEGTAPVKFTVPIQLTVHDWALPSPKEFVTHNNLYQSPDSVAQYYKTSLWSDRHFELMGKSLDVLTQVGNKLCVICLVEKSPAINNTESMVRWVRKPDGSYEYDFTIMEKYLDLYATKAGKPGILQIYIWETQAKKDATPLAVTVVNPTTGMTDHMPQPPYCSPENEAFWRPVMTELRKRLERRGWFDVAAVVNASYCLAPPKEFVTIYRNIWPDGKWMNASHANPSSYAASEGSMPVPYSEWVWGSGRLYNPETDKGGKYQYAFYPRAWTRGAERIELSNPRAGTSIVDAIRDGSALAVYRMISEAALQGNLRGIGRVGGDFWPLPAPAGKPGQFVFLCSSYGGCSMPENTVSLTTPGPDGAVFNERLESLREGVQIAEAIIFVQKAVDSGQIEGELAQRAAAVLDERARYYLRMRFPHPTCRMSFECSNWQERDRRLFALAVEIAKATKPR